MLLARQWDATQRTVALKAMAKHGIGSTRDDCGRVVLSRATNEVASVVAIDGGTAWVVWGAAAPALDALLAEKDTLWSQFDGGTTALALATVRRVQLVAWRAQHPHVHVLSSPSAKEHLLISAMPAEEWRRSMLGDSRPQHLRWARTVAWVCADRQLHFEPPVTRWRYSSAWNGMDDRSFRARRAFGSKDELVAPGIARINKLSKADFHASVPVAPLGCGEASVEAIERLGPLQYGGYPDEADAILRFISLVEVIASSAATCIQKAWRLAVADPAFAVCRRRLLREFTLEQPPHRC